MTTGNGNTLIGHEAGYDITSTNNNTYVGRFQGTQHTHAMEAESNNIVLSDGNGFVGYKNSTPSLQSSSGTRVHHFATSYDDEIGAGFVAGAAANTWHRITDINFNLAPWNAEDALNRITINWANLNPTYGYVGRAQIDFIGTGANNAYTGNCSFSSMPDGTMGYELPVKIATHTGSTSLIWRARMILTGTVCNLEVYTNAAQNSGYPPEMAIQTFQSISNI